MSTTVSTNNWDTAFGIKFRDANLAITAAQSSPSGFSGTHTTVDATYTVTSRFETWQMSGGSGSLLLMTLPLIDGTISGGDQADATFSGTAKVQVGLTFVPQPGAKKSGRNLVLDSDHPVSVLSVSLLSGPNSAIDAIKGALQDWLDANLGDFTHVFAAIDLNTKLDKSDAFAWVKPTHLGYAVHSESIASVDDYIFGVLAMTENRSGQNLSSVIDPGIIPEGCDAGFLIAGARVIEKIFAPHIGTLFAAATADDFDTQDDGFTLINVRKLTFSTLTLADGSTVTDAHVDAAGFTMSVSRGFVEIDFRGMKFTWEDKYVVSVDYTSINKLSTNDKGHLELTQTTDPTVTVSTTETNAEKWREIWESIGIGLGVAIIGACLGAAADAALARLAARGATEAAIESGTGMIELGLTPIREAEDPAQQLIARVEEINAAVASLQNPAASQGFTGLFKSVSWKLLGIVFAVAMDAGVPAMVEWLEAYADENTKKMPTLDDFSQRATGGVDWSGSTEYSLVSAQLRGAIQLGLTKKS